MKSKKGNGKDNGKDKSKDEDQIIVVTARCIDITAFSDDIDKGQCEECKEMVWLSPNWRGKKVDKIICDHCFKKENYDKDDFHTNITEACLNNAMKFAKERLRMRGTDEDIKRGIIKIMEDRIGEKINIIE